MGVFFTHRQLAVSVSIIRRSCGCLPAAERFGCVTLAESDKRRSQPELLAPCRLEIPMPNPCSSPVPNFELYLNSEVLVSGKTIKNGSHRKNKISRYSREFCKVSRKKGFPKIVAIPNLSLPHVCTPNTKRAPSEFPQNQALPRQPKLALFHRAACHKSSLHVLLVSHKFLTNQCAQVSLVRDSFFCWSPEHGMKPLY